jgi:uncharacterized protein
LIWPLKTRSVPAGTIQSLAMNYVKTPCIGICSTTSLGDKICRGCKRFNYEVIHWNQYSEEEKRAVLCRIDQLTTQIMEERFNIFSIEKIQQVLDDFRFFYDPELSPYCWLHNLLQKRLYRIGSLSELGVEYTPAYAGADLKELLLDINQQLFNLSQAHFDRYFDNFREN